MTDRPSKYPEWALLHVNDPDTGNPNIIEPSLTEKQNGWLRRSKGVRQTFNWLSNLIDLWVKYIDERLDEHDQELVSLRMEIDTLKANLEEK